MADRGKIMSFLEGLAQKDWRMFHSDSEVQVIAEHALALLKEQEAVEPTWQQGKAFCGSCGKRIPLKIGARYCHKCGKAVKWDG